MHYTTTVLVAVLVAGCTAESPDTSRSAARPTSEVAGEPGMATAIGGGDASLPADVIERDRRDDGWRRWVEPGGTAGSSQADTATGERPEQPISRDSAGGGARSASTPPDTTGEAWEDLSVESLNGGDPMLPLSGDAEGPTVARVQILLDRTNFSPGIIDGYWGKNTAKAVYWLQSAHGMRATGVVDAGTYERIASLAGGPGQLARSHTLSARDVEGPFVSIPSDVYERAGLDCLCYESLREKLAEMFHTSPELLEQLNPGVDLGSLTAGETLNVPAIDDPFMASAQPDENAGNGSISKIVVSDGGHYVHAVDAQGNVLHHFPSTLGSEYAPSPTGDYSVVSIAFDPTWHYQPDLLTGEPDHRDDAILPPGPNNAVGVVWMDLSKEHYGIHGTSAPETIGYATSHGCVRLTNWDARFLAERIEAGVPVEFRDGTRSAPASAGAPGAARD